MPMTPPVSASIMFSRTSCRTMRATARAKCGPHGRLARAAAGTRHQQAREVDAEHEQHRSGRTGKKQKTAPRAADHLLLHRHDQALQLDRAAGDAPRDVGLHGVDLRLRLLKRDAGPQPANRRPLKVVAVALPLGGSEGRRTEDVDPRR